MLSLVGISLAPKSTVREEGGSKEAETSAFANVYVCVRVCEESLNVEYD